MISIHPIVISQHAVTNNCILFFNLTSSRLTANEIQRLAVDYRNWRLATHQVHVKLKYSEKRIRVFLLYLAKEGYYGQLGRSEGLAECTTMIYLHDVAAFFHDIAARQEQTVTGFYNSCIVE